MSTVTEQNRLEIPWIRSLGSALGAVSSAVMLSTLGATGTLIGAALGSLIITIGGAVYAHSLQVTKERVAGAPSLAARRKTRAPNEASVEVGRQSTGSPSAPEDPDGPVGDDTTRLRQSWGKMVSDLPWRRITATAGALFVVAMALIVAFELSAGRAVSSFTGGSSDTAGSTSIPGFSGTDGDSGGTGTDGQQQEQVPQQDSDQGSVPDQVPTTEQDPDTAPSPEQSQAPQPAEVPTPAEEVPTAPAEPQQ